MSLFKLEWHYLGATVCLLRNDPGLCERMSQPDFDFEGALNGGTTPQGESLFFALIRDHLTKTKPNHIRWSSKLNRLSGLSVKAAEMPAGKEGEAVLTRDTLYVSWPFFDGATPEPPCYGDLKYRGEGSGAVVDLPDLGGASHVFLNATLDLADELAECENATMGRLGSTEIRPVLKLANKRPYGLGDFEARMSRRMNVKNTYFHLIENDEGEDVLELVLGIRNPCDGLPSGPEPMDGQTGAEAMLVPEWPCGAVTGKRRACCDE